MTKTELLQQLSGTQNAFVSPLAFLINLLFAIVLAEFLARFYVRYGTPLSNRALLARNFVAITGTTMFIITVVKSSLALSLGLVGALSIIRFRTAIKEPEELAYLFLAISIGLGLGADQLAITFVAFVIILSALYLKHRISSDVTPENMYVEISSAEGAAINVEQVAEVLSKNCVSVDLKRLANDVNSVTALFLIEVQSFELLAKLKNDLFQLSSNLKIDFVDSQRIY